MNRLPLLLMFIFLFQFARTQGQDDFLTSVDFESDFNLIFMPIQINGEPLYMILDTGASFSVLDEEIAKKLQFEIADTRIIERPGGEVRLGKIKSLNFNIGTLSDKMPMASANLKEGGFNNYIGRSCAGILGYDFIKKYVFQIDYFNKRISIGYSPEKIKGHQAIDNFKIVEGMPIVKGTIFQSNERIQGNWLIDTGSMMSMGVNEEFFEEHLKDKTKPIASLAVGFGGSTLGKMYKLNQFEFLGFTFDDIVAGHALDGINEDSFNGVIGGELLSRFKVTLDYPNNILQLEENTTYNKPVRWDLSGLLLADNKGIEVLHVYANSPAAKANIQIGDLIVEINGIDTKKLGLPKIWKLFHYEEGKTIDLKIKKASEKVLTKRIMLKDYFKP